MTALATFQRSLAEAAPPGSINLALEALWWAGKGEWDRAHACAQQREGDPDCDWVHAHLHREEGDLTVRDRDRRAGRPVPDTGLTEEWVAIAGDLLSRGPGIAIRPNTP